MMFVAGTRLDRYEIHSKLGEGGMGEVYLAQDTKLDRKVALKILPNDVAANQDRMRRFVQEAKSAAALNHPNIAHIYEIDECDGTNFIAMEFVEGVTLGEKIHRERTELRKLRRYIHGAITRSGKGIQKGDRAESDLRNRISLVFNFSNGRGEERRGGGDHQTGPGN